MLIFGTKIQIILQKETGQATDFKRNLNYSFCELGVVLDYFSLLENQNPLNPDLPDLTIIMLQSKVIIKR